MKLWSKLASMFSKKAEEVIIKGNINGKGQHIYHIPGGKYYDIAKPVATFSSVTEAEKAGFRKSRM